MFFQIKSYINFLLNSKNKHGVHSPFIYDLVTKCFYAKTNAHKVSKIKLYKNQLLKNKNRILVKDFGKGSRIFGSNKREISKIAKVAGISKKRSKLLIRLVEYFNSNKILEIGTSLGIGTASLALGNKNSNIISLEGCPNIAAIAIEQFKEFQLNNINVIIGDFKETLPQINSERSFDLIYFDGNHQKEHTIDYFEQCLKSIHNESVFIFDDIHWSKDMFQAWKYIKNHPKAGVTIDTFYWGFVFFRKEQAKEHFVIRI